MDLQNIIEYIKPYLKAVKILKKHDWMVINNDKLICMNNEASILYTIDIMPTNTIICNTVENVLEFGNYMNNHMYHIIMNNYNRMIMNINNIDIKCEMNNLELDDTFSNLLKLKSKEPMHGYILDNIYLPIFYGYLPINKGDSLDVKGGIMEDNTVLINYKVYKKKLKIILDIYLRLLPLL